MSEQLLNDHPHRRFNPLLGEWILVSPHRAKRPWQGQVEKVQAPQLPQYDPECYLCPGNARIGGEKNPSYTDTFVFQNDFSALLPEVPAGEMHEGGLFEAKAERGLCKVICFTPRHDISAPLMTVPEMRKVVDLWANEYTELGKNDFINHVQIFENKGAAMGASNPHPHCQIWSQESVPMEVQRETERQAEYWAKNGRSLLSDYLAEELKKGERVVCANDHFVALVPFWAVWPYEALVVSRRHVGSLPELTAEERDALSDIYIRLTCRFDNLFEVSFPYSAGIHQKPVDGKEHPEWHLHLHFYPPLLRSASVRKFMVGYEMLGEAQRDITPEQSAERLKALPEVHYTLR